MHAGPRMLIMTEAQLAVLPSVAASPAANQVQGILVQLGSASGQNPAARFPLSELAPYSQPGYEWNPAGQSLLGAAFPFSITQLDGNRTMRALRWAERNEMRVSLWSLRFPVLPFWMLNVILHAPANSSRELH